MKKTDNATQRPWKLRKPLNIKLGKFNLIASVSESEENVNWDEAKASMSLIVRAVNNHDTLLEACKKSLTVLETYFEAYGTGELLQVIEPLKQAIENASK